MIYNKNLMYLKSVVNVSDEYGKKYIELIERAIEECRGCIVGYKTAKNKKHKEKFFTNIGKDYLYCEIHHIIPKCCGGSDESDNLVYLYCTAESPEHLIAHEYLWRSSSLFQSAKSQLAGSFFKMTNSRKLGYQLSVEDAAKLREEYGLWKSISNSGRKTGRAQDIVYRGKIYTSVQLTKIKIEGKFRERHVILDWARYGKHGLRLASGEIKQKPPRKIARPGSMKIWSAHDNRLYDSARSLVGVELEDGKVYKNWTSIATAAIKGQYGLKAVSLGKAKENRITEKQRPKKPELTREQRAALSSRSVSIEYLGIVYPSGRSMESIIFPDEKTHDKQTIIRWAKEGKYGLKIIPK